MGQVLRVGLIGTGYLATRFYIPAYGKLANAHIVAVADPLLERARLAADECGGADIYDDYRKLLARPDIDAVNIVTPPVSHAEISIASAHAGKHIMCEKPLAMNVVEADAMIAAARQAGVKFMVGFQTRFSLGWMRIKTLLDAALIGKPLSVTLSNSSLHPGYRRWFFDRQVAGGGALMDTGIYSAYALLYWFGPVQSVFARLRTARPEREAEGELISGIETEDVGSVSLEFRNETFGVINWSQASEVPFSHLYINGLEGAIVGSVGPTGSGNSIRLASTRIEDPGCLFSPMPDAEADPSAVAQGTKHAVPREYLWHEIAVPELPFEELQACKVASFVDCCLNDTEPLISGEDGRDSLEIIQAAYESYQQGRPVTLPLPR